jgi:hypothetical protein
MAKQPQPTRNQRAARDPEDQEVIRVPSRARQRANLARKVGGMDADEMLEAAAGLGFDLDGLTEQQEIAKAIRKQARAGG